MATYDALNIARFMIRTGIEQRKPISSYKLEKLLYYAWVEYYKRTGDYLFREWFAPWRFGLRQPEVYSAFGMWGAFPILYCRKPKRSIDEDTEAFLREFLADNPGWIGDKLVPVNLRKDFPWAEYYKNRPRKAVPFDVVIGVECGLASTPPEAVA